jgi:hypothetical protein
MPLHSDGGAGGVMLRVNRRAGGIGGGSRCNTMPPKPLEEDFLFIPPLLFVGIPFPRGDALFGGPFSLWQVVLLSMSPTSDADAASPNVNVPPPFALSGASPSLHARHEEQRFLFLFESFEWLHRWHGHNKARRVSDCSVGILLREASRGLGTQIKTRRSYNSYQ